MITEAEISEKFGVSKTPSREALNYLCMEGFLDKIPIGQMFTDAKRNLSTAFAASFRAAI